MLTGPALVSSDRNRVRLQELKEEIEGLLKSTSTDSDGLVSDLLVDFRSINARNGTGLIAALASCPAYRNNSEVLRSTIDMLRHHILTIERPEDGDRQTFAFDKASDLLSALHASALCINESIPRNVAWSEDDAIDDGIANNAVHIYECCKYALIAANRQLKLLSELEVQHVAVLMLIISLTANCWMHSSDMLFIHLPYSRPVHR